MGGGCLVGGVRWQVGFIGRVGLQGGVHQYSKYVLSLEMARYHFFFSDTDINTENF